MRIAWRSFIVMALVCGLAPTAKAQEGMFSAPKNYLLALGDSLTFGFQEAKFTHTHNPADFNTGFVDDFAQRLTATPPGRNTLVVNFGCPGETTHSFLLGPCAYHALDLFSLHDNFDGSQMAAAEAFLAAHPGQVGPILISLGANDTLAIIDVCGLDFDCIGAKLPGVLATLIANYTEILARLRSAAPDVEIVVLELYNPFAVIDPRTSLLAGVVNQAIEAVAKANQARVANPFPAFDLAPPQPQTLCFLTLFCVAGDIHPSDPGYQAIADLLWAASGYARFEH